MDYSLNTVLLRGRKIIGYANVIAYVVREKVRDVFDLKYPNIGIRTSKEEFCSDKHNQCHLQQYIRY